MQKMKLGTILESFTVVQNQLKQFIKQSDSEMKTQQEVIVAARNNWFESWKERRIAKKANKQLAKLTGKK